MAIDLKVLDDIFTDKKRYIRTFMSIQNKERQTVPLILNPVQVVVIDALEKYGRIIIVKARQLGCSTGIIAYFLADCETSSNTVAAVISHEEFATQLLLKKAKFMEASIPDQVRLSLSHRSSSELTWPDTNSSFYIGSARATVFGRGDTIHRLHLSEPAFYLPDKAESLIGGASEAVPASGMMAMESTPNGRVGQFYSTYQGAKEGENNFYPLFFPWWWDPEYSAPYGAITVAEKYRFHVEPDEEESDLMSEHGLTLDQIRWRRGKKAQLGVLFKQEYPENDVDCWLVSGISALPTESLLAMASRIRVPFFDQEGVRKWQAYKGGSQYIVIVDAAKGTPTSDPSVAVVLSTKDCIHVATLRGKFPTDIMAAKTAALAQQYGSPPIVVEREGYGDAIIKFLLQNGYERIYKHKDKQYGFPVAGSKTRPYILAELASAIRTNTLQSWDGVFINEALDFQIIDGKPQAPPGGHDDTVMAMAIGMAVRQFPAYTGFTITRPRAGSYARGVLA